MKKAFIILLLIIGLIPFISCNSKKETEKKQDEKISEEEWNNLIKDFNVFKDKDSKLLINIYASLLNDDEKPDIVIYKDKLVFELTHVLTAGDFTTYLDFSNDEFEGYSYYGIDHDNYYKRHSDITIDDLFNEFASEFKREYSSVSYENGEYVSSVALDAGEGKAYYKINNDHDIEFKIVFDNELFYKITVKESNKNIILPNVNYIDEMPHNEMGIYINELLRELASYNAIGNDYSVKVFDHFVVGEFEYKRLQKEDETYKTLEELFAEIKKNTIDYKYSKYVEIEDVNLPFEKYMYIGRFEDGSENIVMLKLVPSENKVNAWLAVCEPEIAIVFGLKEFLENLYFGNDEEEEFTFDGRTFINTSDCFLVQYKANISGNLDELINIAKNALEESGYEWQSSQGSSDSHFDIYLGDDVAVKVNFRDYMDDYILELTICASFSNKAVDIISYGYESIYLQ